MRARTLLVLLAVAACLPAVAQEWSFSVPRMLLEVTPNPDASVTLDYTVEFHCNDGAHPIDVVDMGLPHNDWDISNMSASIDGAPLSGIKTSTYLKPPQYGVEVPVSPAIQPGETGTLKFQATMPNMVFQDTTNAALGSLQITPTWWGSQYVTGTTDLYIVVYLPDSVNLDEVLYRKVQFDQKLQLEGRKAVAWEFKGTRADGENMVAVSFPKDWMERVVRQTAWGLAWKWWTENTGARILVGIGLLVAFSIWFFGLTGGTGTCLYIPLLVVLVILWAASPTLEALAIPILVLLWLVGGKALAKKKRSYLPPIESVAGGEIKRGLTAPEAAVILERPLGEVLTLAIFGMLKKGLVEMHQEDPLTVTVPQHYQVTRGARREVASKLGTVVRGYEQPFLDAIMAEPGEPVPELDLSKEMRNLVKVTAERMAGFDLERSKEYYNSIVYEAWKEARLIGDVEKRDDYVNENIGWLMLDPGYPRHFHSWRSSGYNYSPGWARGPSAPSAPAVTTGGRTTFGDVAASFAGWSENVAGRMASSMDPVSVGLVEGGVVNLGGMDKVGFEALESMAKSSGSSGGGGGGGGGCACACAGCACACACAGGGR